MDGLGEDGDCTLQVSCELKGPPSAVCVQAVGTAMRCNPVSLVVPCHRVVRAGQGAGHYSGGTRDQLKVWLLQHEKCSFN